MRQISCDASHGKFSKKGKEREREREKIQREEGEKNENSAALMVEAGLSEIGLMAVPVPLHGHFVAIRFVVLIIPNVRSRAKSSCNQKFRALYRVIARSSPIQSDSLSSPCPTRHSLFYISRLRRYFSRFHLTQSENLSGNCFSFQEI